MNFAKLAKHALVAAAAAASVGSAVAVPISVGFNFISFGGTFTGNTGDITTSTTVSVFGGLGYIINGIDANTANGIGAALGGSVSMTDPVPLTLGATFEKTFTTSMGTFTEMLTVTTVDTGPGSRSIFASGTIDDGPGGFDATPVFFSASYTQNPNGQINASFNNSTTPPPPRAPEPASLALVGLALAGLAATRRRRA